MSCLKQFLPSFCALIVCVVGPSNLLRGDSTGNSFSMRNADPVMVENTVLPPGIHLWKVMASQSNRHIVQITNEGTHQVEATILALNNYREKVTPHNQLVFWETPAGAPRAVHAWFAPGENYGQEFTFPAVLVNYSPAIIQLRTPVAEESQPLQKPSVTVPLTVPAPKPHVDSPPVQQGSWAVVSNGAPAPPAVAASSKPKQQKGFWDKLKSLPLTATIAPLIGLIGVVSLVLFLMSYLKRKKRQEAASLS